MIYLSPDSSLVLLFNPCDNLDLSLAPATPVIVPSITSEALTIRCMHLCASFRFAALERLPKVWSCHAWYSGPVSCIR
jgi:hypothetical protein